MKNVGTAAVNLDQRFMGYQQCFFVAPAPAGKFTAGQWRSLY